MKDYVAENERILNEWRKSNEERGETNFADDGIMNKGEFYIDPNDKAVRREVGGEENRLWDECPLRVLFLTKDENTNNPWDVRTETFYEKGYGLPPENKTVSGSFFYQNEACLLYGLLNTKPEKMTPYDDFSWEAALRFSDENENIFARINCKKEAGGPKCENPVLAAAIDRDMGFLKQQILKLDADILVCCGSSQKNGNFILDTVRDIYKDEFEYVNCVEGKGTGMHYNKKRKKLAIDAYHLAFFGYGGLKARYDETVGMYYEFLKYLKKTEGIDFTASHRQKS